MKLTSSQESAVRSWVAAGASLSEVQTRLAAEFKIEMTYLDVRLLVLDLGATIQDKPAPRAQPPVSSPEPPVASHSPQATSHEPPATSHEPPATSHQPPATSHEPPAAAVSVTVDTIVVPGAVASGTVRFSDGVTAKWVFDQMGRLGLEDVSKPGYQPSPADVAAFQQQLAAALQAKGMI